MTDVAGRIRVGLADDAVEIRALVRLSLELDGRFDVVGEAEDGAAAVELARTQRPDVLVLDLAMPVMDGLQAMPLVRRASPATAIVVLSGFDARRMEQRALRSGASAYVEKGALLDRLADAIAGAGSGARGAAAGESCRLADP